MVKCNCGKEFDKISSLNSHARFCKEYIKKDKKKSKYKIDDNLYLCECGKKFEKSQSLNSHFTHCLIHRQGKKENRIFPKKGLMNGWNKFTDDDIKNIRKKSSDTLSKKIKNGEIISSFKNKHHSKESKEKISLSNSGRNNGCIKTKYFDVFCPYENKNVKVQGTWELKYANHLNENNIRWIRSRKINFRYKIYENDYWHTYYPDFFLIDSKEYVEIKGYWWKSDDGRVDDKRKMEMVKKYNSDKIIIIIDDINFLNKK